MSGYKTRKKKEYLIINERNELCLPAVVFSSFDARGLVAKSNKKREKSGLSRCQDIKQEKKGIFNKRNVLFTKFTKGDG